MCKFIAERIITCQCTNENLGNSLTKRDFRLQSGNLVYKMRFSFTKRDSWVTNGTLALHFTPAIYKKYMLKNYFDIIKKYVYNIKIDSKQEDWCMTISEQIKVLCVRCGVSEAELARRLGKSPQSFNSKMKRESFTVEDLDNIADVLGVEFNREFILANGDKV